MAAKPALNARPPLSRIPSLRADIASAEADGVDKGAMVLRLTARDESLLKRDPSIGLDEISFSKGRMTFLGVTVVVGGVTESLLDRTGS